MPLQQSMNQQTESEKNYVISQNNELYSLQVREVGHIVRVLISSDSLPHAFREPRERYWGFF